MHLAQGGVEQEAQESSTKKTICCHAESLLASFAPKNAELCRRPRAAERGFGVLLGSRRAAGISSGISPFSCWPVSAPDPGDQLMFPRISPSSPESAPAPNGLILTG